MRWYSTISSPAAIATRMADQAVAEQVGTEAADNRLIRCKLMSLFRDRIFLEVDKYLNLYSMI